MLQNKQSAGINKVSEITLCHVNSILLTELDKCIDKCTEDNEQFIFANNRIDCIVIESCMIVCKLVLRKKEDQFKDELGARNTQVRFEAYQIVEKGYFAE